MASTQNRSFITGSEKFKLANAHAAGPVDAGLQLEVTVKLRPASGASTSLSAAVTPAALGQQLPAARTYLTREEFAREHGAGADDIAKVEAFAAAHQLTVLKVQQDQRNVVLTGTAAACEAAFGTTLEKFEHKDGNFCGRVGHLSVPADLAGIVVGVFGLDDRPQAKPKFQYQRPPGNGAGVGSAAVAPAALASTSFTPLQLAKLYNFPPDLDGSGQCIGIIELGGGSRPADIAAYFAKLGITAPTVLSISVDGATNSPSTASGADGEVMLDIEVAGAIAHKATIAVYYAPNTDRGFLDAITTAVHDDVNKPSVISISWGAAESNWTQQAMTAMEQAFTDAAAMGVTICCASGDNGSADGETDGKAHVDFPASAPHALGCGGTKLVSGSAGSFSETVWNAGTNSATGGGFSTAFPVPEYQGALGAKWSGRGVPDVAGDADPASGYQVRVDGQEFVIGGTSAVAPLWAGLIALMNQQLKQPVGFLNPLLYGTLAGQGVTHDITQGNNGAQQAGAGWDACTGWGSPNGVALLAALGGNTGSSS